MTDNKISTKAKSIIDDLMETAGYDSEERVIEEMAFMIHELIEVSIKGTPQLPEEISGMLRTFKRIPK